MVKNIGGAPQSRMQNIRSAVGKKMTEVGNAVRAPGVVVRHDINAVRTALTNGFNGARRAGAGAVGGLRSQVTNLGGKIQEFREKRTGNSGAPTPARQEQAAVANPVANENIGNLEFPSDLKIFDLKNSSKMFSGTEFSKPSSPVKICLQLEQALALIKKDTLDGQDWKVVANNKTLASLHTLKPVDMWKLNVGGISNAAADYPNIQGNLKTEINELATIITNMVAAAQDETTCADLFRPLLTEYISGDEPTKGTFGRGGAEGPVVIQKMIGQPIVHHLKSAGERSQTSLQSQKSNALISIINKGVNSPGNITPTWRDIDTQESFDAFKELSFEVTNALLGGNEVEMQARIDEIPANALDELKLMADGILQGDYTVEEKNNSILKAYSNVILLRGLMPGLGTAVSLASAAAPEGKVAGMGVAQVLLSAYNDKPLVKADGTGSDMLESCYADIKTVALAHMKEFFELCGMPVAYEQQDELLVAEDGSQFNANTDVIGDQ